jgi:hypothetical protein
MRVWSAEGRRDAANQQVMEQLFKIINFAVDVTTLTSVTIQGNSAIIFKNKSDHTL